MHPPRGESAILRTGSVHPIATGLGGFTVDDERYSYLDTAPGIEVLYEHDHDDRRHPLVWVAANGAVYDGLGHDAASFESPGHRALLRRCVNWLFSRR